MGWRILIFPSSSKNKGMTLVEVLAIVVLLSIVSTIVLYILINVKNQYNSQKDDYDLLTDTTYVFKVVTKDVRKTKKAIDLSTPNRFILKSNDGDVEYYINNKILKRNGVILSTNIDEFTATSYSIYIKSTEVSTIIYLR